MARCTTCGEPLFLEDTSKTCVEVSDDVTICQRCVGNNVVKYEEEFAQRLVDVPIHDGLFQKSRTERRMRGWAEAMALESGAAKETKG